MNDYPTDEQMGKFWRGYLRANSTPSGSWISGGARFVEPRRVGRLLQGIQLTDLRNYCFGIALACSGVAISTQSNAYPLVQADCRQDVTACAVSGKLAFISVFGEIGPEDEAFFQTLDEALPADAPLPPVYLNSPGGNVPSAMTIGRILRRRAASVETGSPVVEDYHPLCASACVLLAAGAVQRRLTHIGLHSSHVRVKVAPNVMEDEQQDSAHINAYLEEMGISDQVGRIIRDTAYDDIRHFFLDPDQPTSGQDIVKLGFFMPNVAPFDPASALPGPFDPNNSRREYAMLAYEAGSVQAAVEIARSYMRYDPAIQPDFAEADRWLEKAVALGDVGAMHTLAYHLFYGVGGKVDKTRAIALFKAAASQGSAASQNNLGWAYYEGKDVPQSLSDAIYWITRSAEQGEPFAYGSLCEIQAATDFLRDNRAEAYKWCQLALLAMPEGDARGASETAYATLKPLLTVDDVTAGERLVTAWQPLRQTRSTMANVGDDLN